MPEINDLEHNIKWQLRTSVWSQTAWVHIPAVLCINFVTLEILVHFFRRQFPHWYKGVS